MTREYIITAAAAAAAAIAMALLFNALWIATP